MEKLGVIGGMGPLATSYFYEKVIRYTKASRDQDHLDIIIYSMASIPDRTEFILGVGEDPTDKLVEAAKKLESVGATYLAMPCNTAHYFIERILENVNIPFVNMIEETAKAIKIRGLEKVVLLSTEGTIKGKVYNKVFDKYGIECLGVKEEELKKVQGLIHSVKKGELSLLEEKAKFLKEIEVRHDIILGCTELSVLKGLLKLRHNYIDPLDILTNVVIQYGLKSK